MSSSARSGKLRIGTFFGGIHSQHWRDPDSASNVTANFKVIRRYARIAEDAKLDFGFIAGSLFIQKDSAWPLLSHLEPITTLSAVSSITTHLGLVGTVSTSYTAPFDTARALASLDLLSEGRAGWNVVTGTLVAQGKNYGADGLEAIEKRYEIAEEYVDVVRGLWGSWADDAFVRNKETGVYIDPEKLFTLSHKGKHFQVLGPLNVERSRQGHPVVFQAGASPAGIALAARTAEAVFAPSSSDESEMRSDYAQWKKLAAEHGRNPDHILILPAFGPIVGRTKAEAQEQFEKTNRYRGLEHGLGIIARYFNFYDFRPIVDQPFPEDILKYSKNGFESLARRLVRDARRDNLTVGEAALQHGQSASTVVDSAEEIANKIEHLYNTHAIDGLILTVNEDNLRRFAELVVPILQERGLFRTEYESDTLRGNLGLPFPDNPNVKS